MNINEVLDTLGIPYAEGGTHHHVRMGWKGIDCPSCSPNSSKYKLGLRGWVASCWSCGKVSITWALSEASGQPYSRVRELLGGLDRGLPYEKRPRGKLVIPKGVGDLLPIHKRYLKDRGFDTDELVKLWGVQGIGLTLHLAWRIFIPITFRGKVVSWTTRSIAPNAEVRYVTARPEEESINHKDILFGEDFCTHAVVVVEGCFDAMKIGPGSVAVMGVNYSKAQVLRLSRFPIRSVVFDAEPNAQRRARKLCDELSAYGGTTRLVQLESKDPGYCTKKELKTLRQLVH